MDPSSTSPAKAGLRRIAVVHNNDFLEREENAGDGDPPMLEADAEVAETASAIASTLRGAGFETMVLGVNEASASVLGALRDFGADVVFNLVESLGGDPRREREFADLLTLAGIPFTGNGPATMQLANAKDTVRKVLEGTGVPVPRGLDIVSLQGTPDPELAGLRYPLFVKPARTDGSIGIDQGSVVHSFPELVERIARLARVLPPPFIAEEYLPGREINVALFPDPRAGHAVATEIDFSGVPPEYTRIVTYDGKWRHESPEYGCRSVPAAGRVPPKLLTRAKAIARKAFLALGGTAYGRVDMRLDAQGVPRVIDVNPNPCLHPEAGFPIAAQSIGVGYPSLLVALVQHAYRPPTPLTAHRAPGSERPGLAAFADRQLQRRRTQRRPRAD